MKGKKGKKGKKRGWSSQKRKRDEIERSPNNTEGRKKGYENLYIILSLSKYNCYSRSGCRRVRLLM